MTDSEILDRDTTVRFMPIANLLTKKRIRYKALISAMLKAIFAARMSDTITIRSKSITETIFRKNAKTN